MKRKVNLMKQFKKDAIWSLLMVFSTIICFVVGCSITADAKTLTLNKDNTIFLHGQMNKKSTRDVVIQGRKLDSRLSSNDPIRLVIFSGGGQIYPSLRMLDNLNSLNRPIETVTIFSGSMAFHTIQNLGKRYILSNGVLFSHQARVKISGTTPNGTLEETVKSIHSLLWKMDKTVVKRTKGKLKMNSYRNLYRNDFRCYGYNCLKYKLADEVVNARCDESLSGTYEKVVARDIFMGNKIKLIHVMSKCPLHVEKLSYKIYVNGKPLFNNSLNPINLDELELDIFDEIETRVKMLLYKVNNRNNPVIYRTIYNGTN